MEVEVISKTEDAELLVCKAGRGDYYDGFIDDVSYIDIMEPVQYDDSHVEGLPDLLAPLETPTAYRVDQQVSSYMNGDIESLDNVTEVEAKTRAFIEKQLSRGHFGLWEHPQITFAIKGVSRSLMAQITRHRHLSFDVQSMRYVDFSDADFITPASLHESTHVSRELGLSDLGESTRAEWREKYNYHMDTAFDLYTSMVSAGVPKEDARMVLPIGTSVNITVSGNARSFLHLVNLRGKADAQWEIRELAEEMLEELFVWMPYTFNWYESNRPHKISP
jgi:thymidylate synthase (FAD)